MKMETRMVLREQEYQSKRRSIHMFLKKLEADRMHVSSAMDIQNEILEMCDEYEKENTSLKSENEDLKEQVRKLEAQLKEANEHAVVRAVPENILLVFDADNNIYEGEAREVVLDILSEFRERNHNRKRRCDIIEEILACNECRQEPERRFQAIKTLMKGYSHMDAHISKGLAALGLKAVETGGRQKHIRLMYGDDPRYILTLCRSGSDNRGGLNTAIDFKNQML